MRMTIAAVFVATLTLSGSAQEFITDAGAPAVAFPNPDRPVANIVSPIWRDERERDAAGEPRQLVRLLGIKSGMTVADVGAGSGYYVVRLSPIVGPRGRVIAEDVMPEFLPRYFETGCTTSSGEPLLRADAALRRTGGDRSK